MGLRLFVAGVFVVAIIALLAAVQGSADARGASPDGPQSAEGDHGRRQLWLIPSPDVGLSMRAYLFRPPGPGPFPLAVINHGSDEDPYLRARQAMPAFDTLTDWFLQHGYAVLLPQRPGHGATGGRYLESQGDCGSADFFKSGMGAARSITAAIGFMNAQAFIRPNRVVIAGNSAGGWGGLALASTNPAGVVAVVNFAGGRGGHDRNRTGHNCSPDRLVAAAGEYGRTARIPTLWLYAENDSYFPPDLSARMVDAFRAAGGRAEYRLLPPVGHEGHALLLSRSGAAFWMPALEKFLRSLGLIAAR